jgi:hypothetical protein
LGGEASGECRYLPPTEEGRGAGREEETEGKRRKLFDKEQEGKGMVWDLEI